jgi:hypothetical protein
MSRAGTHLRTLGMLIAVLLVGLVSPAAAQPAVQTTAQLHIFDVNCAQQNDEVFSDEPYLVVNGSRVWSGENVDDGDVEPVNLWFTFDDVITVELWEDDGGWTGEDDRMAVWHFWASEAGTGIRLAYIPSGQKARYWIRYEIV